MSLTEYQLVTQAKQLIDTLESKAAREASRLLEQALDYDDDGDGRPSGDDD